MSQDNPLTPRTPTGLMDLATEIRLMIFEEIFRGASGNVISHPLFYVCRTTRSEYITTFSGKIFLYIAGWCTPFEDKKPKPTFTIRTPSDGGYVLPRRLNPRYNHPPACLSHIERVHTLRWLEDDFEAFANSPFSWWISHLDKVVFDPLILEYGDQESVGTFIAFEIKRKDRLIPLALTRNQTLYPGENLASQDREILVLAEARLAQWKALSENQDDEERLSSFTHAWISHLMRTVVDNDLIGDMITAVYGSRHGYDKLTRMKWYSPGAFLMGWLQYLDVFNGWSYV